MTGAPRSYGSPDVAVIGAGMIGLTIAYSIASRGASVAILEKEDIAAGASGSNMGLVLWSDSEPGLSLELTALGWQRILGFEDELGSDLEFRRIPALGVIEDENSITGARAQAALLEKAGFKMEFVRPEHFREIEPNIFPGKAIAGTYCEEGRLNPFLLASALWSRAKSKGVDLRRGFEVVGLEEKGGKITRVVGKSGIVSPGMVIVAAGAWTRRIFGFLGIDLPQYYIHGEMLVSEQVPSYIRGLVGSGSPERVLMEKAIAESDTGSSEFSLSRCEREPMGGDAVLGFECENGFEKGPKKASTQRVAETLPSRNGFFARERGNGQFRIVEDALTQTVSGNLVLGQVSRGSGRFYNEVGHKTFADLSRSTLRYFPALSEVSVIRSWVKPVPFTPDHLPYMGPVAGYDNLFVASGYKSTIILVPLVGEIMAALVLEGKVFPGLEEFYPTRGRHAGAWCVERNLRRSRAGCLM
ncbi:MAG TPA: FAD-binding oxidoreductase [Clostridia bacterium]|nr:FAD-binding oxidoreductase [Clostridia bacterium]